MQASKFAPYVLGTCMLAVAGFFFMTRAELAAQQGQPMVPCRTPFYRSPCTGLTEGTMKLFDQDSFKQNNNDMVVAVTAQQAGVMHSLERSSINDRMTSLQWNLPPGVVVVFFEHPQQNKPGTKYVIWGDGQDAEVKNDGFNDKVSAWAWFYVGR